MFECPRFECPRSRDATKPRNHLKHAAVWLVAQEAARHQILCRGSAMPANARLSVAADIGKPGGAESLIFPRLRGFASPMMPRTPCRAFVRHRRPSGQCLSLKFALR